MLKYHYFFFLFFAIGVQQFHCEIGNLAVKKAKALILNKAQREQCNSLIPEADSCDQAYRAIDKYCDGEAVKIDRECDNSFKRLVDKCNSAEKSIKERCQKKNGYVTAECGRLFERLDTVCRIVSNTQSRHCTKMYRKMESECNKKYNKITLKCKRILDRYKDFCESDLSSNYWNETYKDGEFTVDENQIKIEKVKKMAEEENFFEENNIINYVKSITKNKQEIKKIQLNLNRKPEKKIVKNQIKNISNEQRVQLKITKEQKKTDEVKSSVKKFTKNNKLEKKEQKLFKKSLLDDYNMLDIEELIEKVEPNSKKSNNIHKKEIKKENKERKNIKENNKKKSFLDQFNIINVLKNILKKGDIEKKETGIKTTQQPKQNQAAASVPTKKPVKKSLLNDFQFNDIESEYNEKAASNPQQKPNPPAASVPTKKPVKKSLLNNFQFNDIESEYNHKSAPNHQLKENPSPKSSSKSSSKKNFQSNLNKASKNNLPADKRASNNFFYDFNLADMFNNFFKRSSN